MSYDPEKVRAVIEEAERAHGAQVLLVDRLEDLLDDERRELDHRRRRVREMREAWAERGMSEALPSEATR